MAAFIDLEDSPMFHKQVGSLEQTNDELKDRCQRLHKGCKSFVDALAGACNGDTIFADALESFGGGQEDPLSLSIGGPLISKFIGAFQELATYKDLLRSQVEHVLLDRLTQFMSVDLQEAKDSRRRFDKSIHAYDQARERYASLKKSTREDIVAELEEDLHNSKSAFERTRFSLVNTLMNVESKKKYEFLESFSAIMDAHLRYFKLGYDLLSQMEPLIHQVLTYAQQSKEASNAEQDKLGRRIQEFRTQVEMDNLRAASNTEASTTVDYTRPIGIVSSHKDVQALMQSSANGMVQTIKQGYLLKHSSSLRADWKRRYFVLDSRGTLYYYRTKGPKPMGIHSKSTNTGEQSNGVFGRFRARHNRTSSWNGESLSCRTVDLRTSTIKIDAEDTDLRLCFRIISPAKSYTLQAETEADRTEWINKITGVITSLLNAHLLEQEPFNPVNEKHTRSFTSETMSNIQTSHRQGRSLGNNMEKQNDGISRLLREIPGNDQCAECSAPEPEWASLNFGILMCIECSGAHRNLGVHISKVRSITLDVKVWEPTILELFGALGNSFCNSVWEELLADNDRKDESASSAATIVKPCSHDSFNKKEKYIQMKYVEKLLISQKSTSTGFASRASALWEAVRAFDLREAYYLIAVSDANILNTTYDEIQSADSLSLEESLGKDGHKLDPSACPRLKDGAAPENCLRGCSLLHLACHVGKPVMIELLLQFGADVNMRDFHGRTPLHHCIARKDNELAKFLLRRGVRGLIKDWGGLTALERAMELGSITDEQLFILLAENE